MMSSKKVLWILTVCLALVLAACGGSDTGDTTTTAGGDEPGTTSGETPDTTEPSDDPVVVRAAINNDEDTINPYTYVTGFPGWNMLMMQYDSLMQFDADGVPQPWLAETVEASEDLATWTVTIVDGVTWHDGEPLTIEDVKFAYDYFLTNAAGRFARDLAGVESVEITGEREVTISLAGPSPAFDQVALGDIPIIPQHIWETIEGPSEATFDIDVNIGSGPFKLVEYVPDQSYRFEANPDYFLGAPAVDELVVVIFADDAGALAAIRSGEVDVIFDRVSPEQIELLDAQDPLDISQGPEFTTQMINYDATKAPFDDIAVRQAIDLAVDRQDIVDTVYLGAATVGSPGWVHPDKPVYNPDVAAVYDVDAANALLDDAGYADTDDDGIREFDGQPMSFEYLTNAEDSLRLRISELVSEMLADIGIEVNVASVESSTWEEAVWPGFDINNGRNYEMAMWGWSAPVQANTIRLGQLVHGDPGKGFLNLTGFDDPDLNALVDQLEVEGDPETAQQLLNDIQAQIAEKLPFVLLAYPDGAYVYNSDVYGDWEFIAGQGIVSKVSLLPAAARP